MIDMDYKKKYAEALERAKSNYESSKTMGFIEIADTIVDIFPELAESEDERIRKVIYKLMLGMREEIFTSQDEIVTKEKVLAYLEKQKDAFENGRQLGIMQEQARQELEWTDEKQKEPTFISDLPPDDKGEPGENGILEKQKDILSERAKNITINMLEDGIEGIQRELIEFLSNTINAPWVDVIKSADAYAQRIRSMVEKQKEQKPAEPSDKELERHQKELYDFKVFAAKQAREHHISFVHDFEWNNFCAELLSYFNEKQEWSDEDEEKLKAICTYLRDYSRLAKLGDKLRFNEYCDFLESLRPSWKPSEEQLLQLRRAISGCSYDIELLVSLEEQLKQL